MQFVRRVRGEVPAHLERAFLFGSHARGEARPDSDVDVLLLFRALPPDREPQAGHAERIAAEVAWETGVPVETWSVSGVDLHPGNRTPMLVDALDDGIPLWPPGSPPLRVPFGPEDALWCAEALLQRVEEGSEAVLRFRRAGFPGEAARRTRDDLVRLCTAALLLVGETRPRRADSVRRFQVRFGAPETLPERAVEVLDWAAASFGPRGTDEALPVPLPPGGLATAAGVVDRLRSRYVLRPISELGGPPDVP